MVSNRKTVQLNDERTTAIGAVPGTYMLLLGLSPAGRIPVGRARSAWLEGGFYAYTGSALGPGGLAARLKRYAAGPVRKHRHIDYLLDHAQLLGALVKRDGRSRPANAIISCYHGRG